MSLLLFLTSALIVVMSESEASAKRRDLKRVVLSVRAILQTSFLLISLWVATLGFSSAVGVSESSCGRGSWLVTF